MSGSRLTAVASQAELLEFLVEVSEAVSAHVIDLPTLLRTVADLVRKVIDYEIFVVMLTVEGQGVLEIHHAVGLPEEVVQKVQVPVGKGITGAAAAEGASVVVNDVSKDPRYINALESVRAEMAVPLIARDTTVGVLDLQSTSLDAFGDYERRMMELIASRVSMAVDNARLLARATRQAATLKTLVELSQEFSAILNLDQLMDAVASVTRRLIHYDAYSIFLLEPGGNELKHYTSFRYDKRVHLEAVPLDTGIIGTAARTRQPVLVADTVGDSIHSASLAGVRSEVAAPLILRDRVIGVVGLESDRPNFFTQEHVNVLSMLACQLASAIENTRLYEQVAQNEVQLKADLEAARRLQRGLLLAPSPDFEGIEVAARNQPLREVSGDFYDFHIYSGSHIGILLGDVSGKGAAAALYGGLVSGLLRSLVRFEQSPGGLLAEVNQSLAERQEDPSTFAAVGYAQWSPRDRVLVLANSGLPYPLLRRGERMIWQPVEGLPLGMFREAQYDEVRLELEAGDVLVLVSDGVLESQNVEGDEYGSERLERAITESRDASAEEILENILADLGDHAAGAQKHDDQTLIVMKVKPQ